MIQAAEQAAEMSPAKYSKGKESARGGRRGRAKEKTGRGKKKKMLQRQVKVESQKGEKDL